jgi:hypothetical protein
MDHYGRPHTSLTIALHGGLYLEFIMDRYGGPHTALNIYSLAWRHPISHCNGPLWKAPHCPYYSLAWMPLHINYNGPLWRALNYPYYSLAWRPLVLKGKRYQEHQRGKVRSGRSGKIMGIRELNRRQGGQ